MSCFLAVRHGAPVLHDPDEHDEAAGGHAAAPGLFVAVGVGSRAWLEPVDPLELPPVPGLRLVLRSALGCVEVPFDALPGSSPVGSVFAPVKEAWLPTPVSSPAHTQPAPAQSLQAGELEVALQYTLVHAGSRAVMGHGEATLRAPLRGETHRELILEPTDRSAPIPPPLTTTAPVPLH